jgi:DNA repair protein RecO (recombination protein O)
MLGHSYGILASMIKRQKVEALVLSRRNIGEADRLVTFFTHEHGLIKAVAKGVRRIPSQRGGHLEPYTKVLTLLSESRAGTYVGAVETQDYFSRLRSSESALHHARNIALIVRYLFDELEAQPQIYDGMVEAWQRLPHLPPMKQRLVEGAMIVLVMQQAGLLPELKACQVCRARQPTDSIVLDAFQGGWRCLSCHTSWQGTKYSLSPRLLQVARLLTIQPQRAHQVVIAEEESGQLLETLRKCVADAIEQSTDRLASRATF